MTRKYSNNIFDILREDDHEKDAEHTKEDVQNETENLFIENVQRSNAFFCLKNKKNISKRLFKTKMCMYVEVQTDRYNNKTYINNCMRPSCHFAHAEKELNCAECVFGDTCKFKDSKTRPCTFIHPDEDMGIFKKRTGLEHPGKQFCIQPLVLS